MDMSVDIRVFDNIQRELKNRCKNIDMLTDMFMRELRDAQADFDDPNYKETCVCAAGLKAAVDNFLTKLDETRKNLDKLENIVAEYLFKGAYDE